MTTTMSKVKINSGIFAIPVHPDYYAYSSIWSKIQDAIDGEDAVKDAGETYLPRLTSQKEKDYLAYKTRATFLNTSARVLNTNQGTIIRRSPKIEKSTEMEEYFSTDTSGFNSFFEMFRFVVRTLISKGRLGLAIDIKNDRPVPIKFGAEEVINWTTDDEGNLTSVIIAQSSTSINEETYVSDTEIKYYKFYLKDGVYTIDTLKDAGTVLNSVQPSLRGRTFNKLPFVPLNAFGIDISPMKPPILDVVNINYSHYRTSADLETGRHFVGLPQAVVTGGSSTDDLYVGSSKAWVIPNDKAKAFYMEFLGQGLDGLANALKEKEGQMAQFSAQLVDTSTRGSEAEGTVRLRYSSDAANLSDIALSAELGLNKLYSFIAEWLQTDSPVIDLNKDFLSDKLSHQELKALTEAWLEGGLSEEEYRYNLEKGEILPSENK